MEYLETLDLSGTAIKELPFSIEHLIGLSKLYLRGCKNLEALPSSICKLASLSEFDLFDCSKLDKLPVNMENLSLSAGRNVESSLPYSSTCLRSLIECLAFHPSSGLSFTLEDLCLNNCNLTEIPEDIGCLSSLKTLELSRNDFECLPTSIKQLSKLQTLLLNDCNMLSCVTMLPLNLLVFEAMNCKQLQSLPDTSEFAEFITSERITRTRLTNLEFLFTNSPKLDEKTFSNVFQESLQIIQLMAMAGKKYQKEVRISICYPGSKIPEWFCTQSCGSSVNVQLSSLNCSDRKFLGFALCAVVAFKGYCYTGDFSLGVLYECCFQSERGAQLTFKGKLTVRADRKYKDSIFIDSDHVLLGYDDNSHIKLRMDNFTTCTVKFNAQDHMLEVPAESQNCKLKYCGVCPIYAGPEIIQTSISDEKLDSNAQDSVSDLMTIPEKKPIVSISSKIVRFYRSLHDKVGLLWLSYFWIFFACLFCGLCVFGMLVLLVLQLSHCCEMYLSSHMQKMQVKRI